MSLADQGAHTLQVLVLVVGRDPRIAYFHGLILSLIYSIAKPLIYQGREIVSKILIFGTAWEVTQLTKERARALM